MSQISIWNHFHDPKILSHPDGLGQNEWAVNLHRKLDQKMASDVRGIHLLKKRFGNRIAYLRCIVPRVYNFAQLSYEL